MRKRPIGFRLIDLGGSVPLSHTPILKTPSDRDPLPSGQIWVDRGTDVLWTIVCAPCPRDPEKKRVVKLALYDFPAIKKTTNLKYLKLNMQGLEIALKAKRKRLARIYQEYESGQWGNFPSFESLAQSLGIDPKTGCRID